MRDVELLEYIEDMTRQMAAMTEAKFPALASVLMAAADVAQQF